MAVTTNLHQNFNVSKMRPIREDENRTKVILYSNKIVEPIKENLDFDLYHHNPDKIARNHKRKWSDGILYNISTKAID